MGSTLGGVFIGVGLTLLVFSLACIYLVNSVYAPLYDQVIAYAPKVEELRKLLYSPEVDSAINGYETLMEKLDPDKLEEGLDMASEIVEEINLIMSMLPNISGNLSSILAYLDSLLDKYSDNYAKVEEVKNYVATLGSIVMSDEYNETLEALAELASLKDQPSMSSYAEQAEKAYNYMVELRQVYVEVNSSLNLLDLLTPEELGLAVEGLEGVAGLAGYLTVDQSTWLQIKELVAAATSEEAKSMIKALKDIKTSLPPEELRSMLGDARRAVDEASKAIDQLKRFSPRVLTSYLYAVAVLSVALIGLGVFLARKERSPSYYESYDYTYRY